LGVKIVKKRRFTLLLLFPLGACVAKPHTGGTMGDTSGESQHLGPIRAGQLAEIISLPSPKEIFSVRIWAGINWSPPSFNERQFPFILEKARTVHPNDPVLEQWSYYPVCRVSFETKQGHYGLLLYLPVVSGRFMLKLGGLGILTLPDKSKGALMFPKEELCPTKDETD
jgi:hypothetical protein